VKFIDLNASKRTEKGNGPARQLRRHGLVPAVIYGPGKTPEMLSVNFRELEKILKSSKTTQVLLNLHVEDGGDSETRSAMLKELQSDPVTREILHADFYEIDMDRKIRMLVPVVPKGKAAGVEMGGMLQVIRRELEVLCLPGEIPDAIEIDVTPLEIGGSVHVKEIPLAEGVEIPTEVDFTVVTCLGKMKEEEEEVEAEEGIEEEGEEAAAEEAAE
jgi:large subunit ribosomal protein L25